MTTVVVVDCGMGNLRSVARALEHVAPKARVLISQEPAHLRSADRIVLPGQGAMPDCMRHLNESGLCAALLEVVHDKPLLGVCIGEQMLFESSAEGHVPGLGLFPGRVIRFPAAQMQRAEGGRLKVPHMGWNAVEQTMAHPMWSDIPQGAPFYFVHSYFAEPGDISLVSGCSEYGLRFTCAVARDNIFATQFHPEKSARYGLKLFENFLAWRP